MRFLRDKRKASLVALLSVLFGSVAVVLGAGLASAAFSPCNDGMGDGDHHAEVDDEVFVGVEAGVYPSPDSQQHQHYCFAASGGEDNQSWVKWEVWPTSDEGVTVDSYGCFTVGIPGCPVLLGATGANVGAPSTGANLPGDGDGTSSTGAGTAPGTCVYVNGMPTCQPGLTIGTVTINEADLVPTVTPHTPMPPCTGINNVCVPVGGTVETAQNSDPTVHAEALGTPIDVDPGPQCVQVNATC